MRKRILILKACGGSDEPHECNGICEQAQLYGIESVCKCVKDNEDLENILYSHGLFDYIYLSAHGNSEGFSSEDEKVNMSWQKLPMLLCKSKCMNEDSILLLSCCRGGLMEVAYNIFLTCQQICYVLGPRQSLPLLICISVSVFSCIIWRSVVLTLLWHVKRLNWQQTSDFHVMIGKRRA